MRKHESRSINERAREEVDRYWRANGVARYLPIASSAIGQTDSSQTPRFIGGKGWQFPPGKYKDIGDIPASSIKACVSTLIHMATVHALLGPVSDGPPQGLINQTEPTEPGSEPIASKRAEQCFRLMRSAEIASTIQDTIRQVAIAARKSSTYHAYAIDGDIIVGLPEVEHGMVKSRLMEHGSDLSIAEHVEQHNSWNDEKQGNRVRFERIDLLKDAGGGRPRMIVFLSSPEVLMFLVPRPPSVDDLKVRKPDRGDLGDAALTLDLQYADAPIIIRPDCIRYVDGIGDCTAADGSADDVRPSTSVPDKADKSGNAFVPVVANQSPPRTPSRR